MDPEDKRLLEASASGQTDRVLQLLEEYGHQLHKYKDADGNEVDGIAKGFLSLPVKKEGGGILPEKVWKEKLFNWVKNNAPDSITQYM